jgi:phage shock protein A
MGRRMAQLYEVKVNALLDLGEDPREVLDYSCARQQELLPRIRRACPAGRREQVPARTAR